MVKMLREPVAGLI